MAKKTEKELEIQRLDKKTPLQMFRDYVMITVASFIYAVSVSMFLDPNSLAPGGITGIAIILNRLFGIETGTWMLLINIPILLIGIWKFGLRFILSTIYCTAMTSLFTNLLTPVGAVTTDPLLASLAGSALMAVSMGWVFKAGSTTGGTDIIIKLLRLKFPYLKTGALFFLTDVVIVIASAFVFRNIDKALYAGIVVIITSVVLDVVLYGRDEAKLIYYQRPCGKNRREIVGGAGHWCDLCTGQWCLQRQGEERHYVRHEEKHFSQGGRDRKGRGFPGIYDCHQCHGDLR